MGEGEGALEGDGRDGTGEARATFVETGGGSRGDARSRRVDRSAATLSDGTAGDERRAAVGVFEPAATRAETISAGTSPLAVPACATAAASRKKSSKLMRSAGWRLSSRRISALTSAATLVGTFCSASGIVSSMRFSSGNLMRSSPRSILRSRST